MSYKLISTWSAPNPDDLDDFEKFYADVHVPIATRVPHLQKLILTRTDGVLAGEPSAFYRTAELVFDTYEDFQAAVASPEWTAMREDAGLVIERYGVALEIGVGEETTLGGQ